MLLFSINKILKIWHNLGHFRGGLHNQSLDWYWQTKQYRKKYTQTKHDSKQANNAKHSKTKLPNYPGSVASCDTRPGNEVGLFYNAPTSSHPIGAQTGWQQANWPWYKLLTSVVSEDLTTLMSPVTTNAQHSHHWNEMNPRILQSWWMIPANCASKTWL